MVAIHLFLSNLLQYFFLTFFFSISNHIYVKDIFINEKLFSDHVEKKNFHTLIHKDNMAMIIAKTKP